MKTKKVGRAGRYGSRYGLRIRKKVDKIERLLKQKWECPKCSSKKLYRVKAGIWVCKKCHTKFAGNAYVPFGEIR